MNETVRATRYETIVSETKEITVETERLVIIRRRYQAVEEWCAGCGKLALMIRPDQAAAVIGLTLRNLFSQIDTGALHFRELPDGLLLICLNSLLETPPDAGQKPDGQGGQLR